MNSNRLEQSIRDGLKTKPLMLMTHIVLGYPSFDDNMKALKAMASKGVLHIELQIPFSEPTADGPVIARACQVSLERGTSVEACFDFAKKAASELPEVSFLFMTYANILYKLGIGRFAELAAKYGIKGVIIPDLPPEEADEYIAACRHHDLATVFIFTPATHPERLKTIADASAGLVYCVGRTGVTGKKTNFNDEAAVLLNRYRQATSLPIGIGFGISSKADIDFLKGKSDLAVIGSKLLVAYDEKGADGVTAFLDSLELG